MQRSRQTPQRKSRFPSRSIYTSMHSSVSSTLVTVCAFKCNCFLIKVSMSTSVPVLSYSLVGNTKLARYRGALQILGPTQLQALKRVQLRLHFSERNPKLNGAILETAILVRTNLRGAVLTGCSVYGISAWGVRLDGAVQTNLNIA